MTKWGKIALIALLGFAPGAGADMPKKRPSECLTSKTNGFFVRSVKTTRLACADFDPDGKTNVNGVCVFQGNNWKYGMFRVDLKTRQREFVPRTVCDQGVYVIPTQTTSDLKSPRLADHLAGRTDVVTFDKGAYTSLLTAAPMDTNEIPSICYQKDVGGVPSNPSACATKPEDPGYCEFVDLGKSGRFRGSWWVTYSSPNRVRRTPCVGGVKATDLAEAAAEYGESYVQNVVKKMSQQELIAAAGTPKVGEAVDTGLRISGCYYTTGAGFAKKSLYVPCLNASTAGFELWSAAGKNDTLLSVGSCFIGWSPGGEVTGAYYVTSSGLAGKNKVKNFCDTIEVSVTREISTQEGSP